MPVRVNRAAARAFLTASGGVSSEAAPTARKRAPAFRLVAPTLSENDVEAQIRGFLEIRGWLLVRNHVGAFVPWRVAKLLEEGDPKGAREFPRSVVHMHPKGTSDWLAVHTDYPCIWYEVKAPGAKPTKEQLAWLFYMVQKRGFLGGWFDSVDEFTRWYVEHVIPKAAGA